MATTQLAPQPTPAPPTSKFVCPHCGDPRPYRSERRGWDERITCWLRGVLPYRCRKCDQRFFARRPADVTSTKS